MPNSQADQWRRLFEQKRLQLLEEDCVEAININSFEDLESRLRTMSNMYNRTAIPNLLERLKPSLQHLQSFTGAITSASQYSPVACLVWGSIQAVVQCACASTDLTDYIVTVLSDLNHAVPLFESYISLFPDASELQYPLQDIFDVYVDFCLGVIAYIKRRGSINFFRFFWTSEPTTLLEKTRAKLQKHFETFQQAAALVHRRKLHLQHLRIEQTLTSDPLQIPKDAGPKLEESEDHFPISTVAMFRNYAFHGREDIFQQIQEAFGTTVPTSSNGVTNGTTGGNNDGRINGDAQKQASTNGQSQASNGPIADHGAAQSPACCVLHGLGGIGKTQTALEFTYRARNDYDAMFWLHSDHNAALTGQYMAIAEKLHLLPGKAGHDGQDQGRAIKKVFEWLQNTSKKWLLVFDNVEDINDLHAFLPTKTTIRGHVIVTTQHPDFYAITEHFKLIPMSSFDRDAGCDLLFQHLQRKPRDPDEAETGKQISDALGGLPLAIATIGGYINASDCSTAGFLKDFQTSSNAWEAGAIGPVRQYEKTLQSVFEIALQELPKNARLMLNILAFLNPDYIPEDLFLSDTTSQGRFKSADLTEVVRVLRRRQLIRRDTSGPEPFISIHRTVQWNVLLDLSNDYDHRWRMFQHAFNAVCNKLPEVSAIDNPEPDKWAQFERYVPQILSLRTHCLWPEPPVELPEEFVQVLSDMATFMWHAGLMSQGYDALITAEHILDDKEAPKENPLRGNIHEHIGIIASFHGVSQRFEAMDRRYKALEARRAAHAQIPSRKVTREDEIRLWNVESDMAFGLMQEEDFDKSEVYIEKCHEQYKKWGTPDDIPFEYLKYNHIVSYIRMSQKKPVAAIRHCKEAAKLGEKCAGVDHPMTQLCRFSLTNHLYLAGELEEAIQLSDSVLTARSKVCGEFNPFTLESHAMCGYLRFANAEYEKAEHHLVRCLDKRKRSVWNPEGVARAQFIYSLVLDKLGKPADAAKYYKEAAKVRDRYIKMYPDYLRPDPDDLVVFDQMVCLWGGRFSGALADGAAQAEEDLQQE